MVYRQGDPADAVFYVEEGKVKVCIVNELGKKAVVAIHDKGDFFSEGCLLGQLLRLATVATMTECAIMRIDKPSMVRVLHDEPEFSERSMAFLLARNARVEEDLVDQLIQLQRKSVWRGRFSSSRISARKAGRKGSLQKAAKRPLQI
jgi:CRP/FNR family transcriptional regulator, cyclic AMP receptor protein